MPQGVGVEEAVDVGLGVVVYVGVSVGVWVGREYTMSSLGCLLAVPSSFEEYLIMWLGPLE